MIDKKLLNRNTRIQNFLFLAVKGVDFISHHAIALIAYAFSMILIPYYLSRAIPATIWQVTPIIAISYIVSVTLVSALLGLIAIGAIDALPLQNDFTRVGFVNSAGEPPLLKRRKMQEDGSEVFCFWAKGFPLSEWTNNISKLETAFNRHIAKISEGADLRTIVVTCAAPGFAFKTIPWDDKFINREEDNLILLGESPIGKIILNLNVLPHILIGGSTGSGKTVLLKSILWQAVQQADVVYIADFKGGVDYSAVWHKFTHIITTEKDLLDLLNQLSNIIEERKQQFRDTGSANLQEYRKSIHEYAPRYIFACDEVAELLDKTGADKERKELLNQIEARLSLIARQGRAFGVHLILATQRPDANILPGQIKNNMDVRICGKADATLSTIILGDGKAHELIPKDSQGRFVLHDGTVFQGYYIDR